ncbi:DUF1190 domain-containing protein [Asticcacaulis sp. ZE23SCel15]|uniref:DUF1190 domain-containing protein n=1 Tax=Asticcacaulis sp. ZE23SCel15 TaxID=3059027 RepID=UPI00265EBC2E|nr:DUF1190 domain-containing protein [Asticcacaulis sp. ZE23SCel15]WKL56727.1 DUF1190 domain-containing protein [Asticcacaulis sp. ZE23SCel15]
MAMLSACGPQTPAPQAAPPTEQMLVYKTLDECKAAQDDDTLCETAFAEAWQWQEQQPGFTAKQQCEAEYGAGNCESRANPSGGNWFVPLMAGYMMSNAMNNMSRNAYMRERERGNHSGAYPVFVNRGGQVSTYGGSGTRPLGYSVAPTANGSRALPSPMDLQADPSGRGYAARGTYGDTNNRYQASSRGGFGKSSTSRGSCCG